MEKEKEEENDSRYIYGLQVQDICRSMGFVEQEADPLFLEKTARLLGEVTAIAHPVYHYVRKDDVEIGEEEIRIGGGIVLSTGKTITRLMKGSSSLVLFLATAGMEFQKWSEDIKAGDDPLDIFIADTIGSSVVGKCTDAMEQQVVAEFAPMPHTHHFCPGYAGWNLSDQKNLFSCLPPGVCGVTLTDSCLMYPIKSVSGIIGLGEKTECKVHECDLCNKRDVCLQRRLRERRNQPDQRKLPDQRKPSDE